MQLTSNLDLYIPTVFKCIVTWHPQRKSFKNRQSQQHRPRLKQSRPQTYSSPCKGHV